MNPHKRLIRLLARCQANQGIVPHLAASQLTGYLAIAQNHRTINHRLHLCEAGRNDNYGGSGGL
jgi:hypothetical protein